MLLENVHSSNVQDGGRNYLWSSIENTNERNIQRRIWEATEKPTKSYQWELWYHHDRNVQSGINELKASLKHTETVLEEKLAKAEKKVEKLQENINELWDYQVDPERLEFTERKIVELPYRTKLPFLWRKILSIFDFPYFV